ncbi:MAG: glycoside hydrolase family 57 protein [Prolixibacteraceae bacterium]|nr:glycoside hydrolase family 57 protein [Prolixibacteraceae bacterium]
MKTICLYFQLHQPFRYRRYRFFDIGNDHYYYDDYANETILRKVADQCYLPANKILLDAIKKHKGKFKVAFSFSGIALEQFSLYAPEVIESFKKLADTGCVEFLAETYSHSLVALKSKEVLQKQIEKHSSIIEKYFGQKPTVFRNTELIYSDEVGAMIADFGFKGMLTEGAKHVLGWKSPNFLYNNPINPRLKVLMRNFKLSDDISFRFSNSAWSEYPLTADKYVDWILKMDKNEEIVNLFMDYETFGEHQKASSGIFSFLSELPTAALKTKELKFATPGEIIKSHQPVSAVHVPHSISWADEERDLSAWLGNELQEEAFNKLYDLQNRVEQCNDADLLKDWEYLQISDHFYYMCTKFFSDGEVHKYFNPYESPYEAFINYMNVLSDFTLRLNKLVPETDLDQQILALQKELDTSKAKIAALEAAKKKTTTPAKTKKKITKKSTAKPKTTDKKK